MRVAGAGPNRARAELSIDGGACGAIDVERTMNFVAFVERLTVGYGTAPGVGGYTPPAVFTGVLDRLVIALDDDQGGAAGVDVSLVAQ